MKKLLVMFLLLTLTALVFAGCGGSDDTGDGDATADGIKTGLGVVSSVAKSTPADGETNGVAETDSIVAAVIVDGDKIVNCKIDGTQTKIEFDSSGKLVTPVDSIFKSKQDLGTDYGMKSASGIGKEWNEQADAFADYCKGKTIEEVKGIAVNDEGIATDSDLASSVTIHIGDFILAVEKAATTADVTGAGAEDTLGLGVETNISHSTAATADEDGIAQAYTNYVATSFGDGDKITSTVIDGSQSDVNYNTTGKITSDLEAELQSKQELGEDYGLAKASGIGKEWFEQADAFAEYVVGMTPDEVKGIKVNDEGVAEDADLTSSVTISVSEYISMIEKAAGNAS